MYHKTDSLPVSKTKLNYLPVSLDRRKYIIKLMMYFCFKQFDYDLPCDGWSRIM